jgi:hypothetical protein
MVRVTYKHWKTEVVLVVEGTMPSKINNPTSDRIVVFTEEGVYEDIIKETIIKIEELP